MHLNIEKIISLCNGRYFGDEALLKREVSSFVIDSRQAAPGCAYIAFAGERVDGHSFIKDTFTKGAVVCIGEKAYKPESGEAYIQVDSSMLALGEIAAGYMKELSIPVVGITGSVGKTGTKEMVASVLSEKFRVAKTQGNHNNEIGLPLTCLNTPDGSELSVLEMGISAAGEMDYLTQIASPGAAVVTNIGVSHMEILGSQRGIFDEKIKIASRLPSDGILVLNGDDEFLSGIDNKEIKTVARIVRVGFDKSNDFYANVTSTDLKGSEFSIHGFKSAPEGIGVTLNIPGRHLILNALAAAAIGEFFGLTPEEIKAGLHKAGTIPGRMNVIKNGSLTIIDDSYNASPVSMKAAIEALSMAEGRKICVLGDMYEIGEASEQMHYDVGRFAAEKGVDVLFVCGRQAADIAKGAAGLCMHADILKSLRDEHTEVMMSDHEASVVPVFYIFDDNESMIKKIKQCLRPGDTVLIKASNGMRFSEVAEALKE